MADILFHPDIEQEVKDSYEWYENQAVGLGDDFLVELPNTWPKFHKNFRRFLLSKFPFSVIYRFSRDTFFVVAVMHNSRKPGYWNERT